MYNFIHYSNYYDYYAYFTLNHCHMYVYIHRVAQKEHVFEMGSSRESEGRRPPHSA